MWENFLDQLKAYKPDRFFLHGSEHTGLRFSEFLALVNGIHLKIKQYPHQYILIQAGKVELNLAGIMACILSDKIPVLDFKESLTADHIYLDYSYILSNYSMDRTTDNTEDMGAENLDSILEHIFDQPTQTKIIFCTSGTSGHSVFVDKSWSQLIRECYILRDLYQLNCGDSVLSLVSPLHLYGFLHGFMVPFLFGLETHLYTISKGLYPVEIESGHNYSLLCVSPALWDYALTLSNRKIIKCVVSSGAALGNIRTQNALRSHLHNTRFIEVIGSTETGGIAFRWLKEGERIDYFQLFDGVELSIEAGKTWIRSPYVDRVQGKKSRFQLSDKFISTEDPKIFQFLGRFDRIFKYAGKRFSLDETEQQLRKILKGRKVCCQFLRDDSRIKGGILRAIIEGEPVPKMELKLRWMKEGLLPFPDLILFRPDIPLCPLGKPDFKAAFDHNSGV